MQHRSMMHGLPEVRCSENQGREVHSIDYLSLIVRYARFFYQADGGNKEVVVEGLPYLGYSPWSFSEPPDDFAPRRSGPSLRGLLCAGYTLGVVGCIWSPPHKWLRPTVSSPGCS